MFSKSVCNNVFYNFFLKAAKKYRKFPKILPPLFATNVGRGLAMNAILPNEWRNGLTVEMGIYAAFGKDWLL